MELVGITDFVLPLLDEPAHPIRQRYEHEHTPRWSRSVDAFVFVTSEYDHFCPPRGQRTAGAGEEMDL